MVTFRPDRDLDRDWLRAMRDAVARSLEILRSALPPDTFLGRKTHEPFPKEDDK
jgi:hypothetical protein